MAEEKRIILKNVGRINPLSIDEYLAEGGYQAAIKALACEPVEIINEMVKSSLRGRGGAGFSTGLKKKFTSEACRRCERKYLICNADEGEPGTFKDRIIMENDPHRLIEGMIIAAYAIGASKAFIYIRGEYHKSIRALQKAIGDARMKNYLGENIFGTTFSLDIEIKLGAGSYLCGEELTLLESLEGKRGYPRIKPPFPAEKGLFGFPTLINNVETLATIPTVIEYGAEWYTGFGTKDSPGTKIFTLSGDVENPGYFELELGVTLREIIFDFGGGIKKGKKCKAVLIGGAAGTFVDKSVLDTPIGYDTLKEKGAVLGSGAIMVMADDKSIPAITESILEFFKHESCGKCVPCRVGMSQLVRMIKEFNKTGKKEKRLLDEMVAEADYMAKTSLCPLGQSPILPLRSLQRYFADSFLY
ncbi:MAG: NADH-quinone oxidoreductase subunit NuoF [Bacteroidales bacterium]|nr:NADH-quinone oxidoreductase subunit NuoF [Bacteroidales bacterium]